MFYIDTELIDELFMFILKVNNITDNVILQNYFK